LSDAVINQKKEEQAHPGCGNRERARVPGQTGGAFVERGSYMAAKERTGMEKKENEVL